LIRDGRTARRRRLRCDSPQHPQSIFDNLPWDHTDEHLFHLQGKLNGYLKFIESGELVQKFPSAVNQPASIVIVLKYAVPDRAVWFFEKAQQSCKAAGFELSWRVL
jgi:hypothetical protein